MTDICVVGDGGLNSLEALGKSVLEQSLAAVTTTADWKPQPSTVTFVIICSLSLFARCL